jgi:hypothetical protein
MSFTVTKLSEGVVGNQRKIVGKYVSDSGSVGGDINTGLHSCHEIMLTPKGSAVQTNAPVVNEDLPCAGDAVTIVTDANAEGYFIALGD